MEEARFDSPKSPKNYVRPKVSCTLKTDDIDKVEKKRRNTMLSNPGGESSAIIV